MLRSSARFAASALAVVLFTLLAPQASRPGRRAAGFAAADAPRAGHARLGAVHGPVPDPQFVTLDERERLVRLDLDGFALRGDMGGPALPVRILTVAVPPLGEVRVNAVASDLVTQADVTLSPQPVGEHSEIPARNLSRYGVAGSATPVAARLIDVSWMRNQRIARIAIEPASYEPAASPTVARRRVDVDVQVQPMGALGEPIEPNDPFEGVYRQSLVNYEQGKAWRRTDTRTLATAARRMGITPQSAQAVSVPTTSRFAGHTWVKFAVQEAGFYTVDFSSVRSLALFSEPGEVSFDQLRVVTLPGYPIIPQDSYCDTCDYQQVAIGTFDTSDPARRPAPRPTASSRGTTTTSISSHRDRTASRTTSTRRSRTRCT
ncbi:MAG: hypothetical protein IPJ04_12215 [Candidatus Eisenbacteria bacterium]|nr:hypothetical protein [Candidatus Eisenbacteria bacterium]